MNVAATCAVAAEKGAFDVSIVIHRLPSICRMRAIQSSLQTSVNLTTTAETRCRRGSSLKISGKISWNLLQLSQEKVQLAWPIAAILTPPLA
jgi:hypothetical protein